MNLAMPDQPICQLLPAGGHALAPGQSIDRILHVHADFARAGAWTGVSELVELAYLDLRARGRHDLIETHNYGLYMLLPDYRNAITLKYASLTDTSQGPERTRNFPLDRAYRIVHSVVRVILEWKALSAPQERWAIVVAGLDRAQTLARRFFNELARRANGEPGIAVLAVRAPEGAPELPGGYYFMPIAAPLAALTSPACTVMTPVSALAASDNDLTTLSWEKTFPGLIATHLAAGDTEALAHTALRTLCMYNHFGYYHEARSFSKWVIPHLLTLAGDDQTQHWNFIASVAQSHIASGEPERGLDILMQFAPAVLTAPAMLAKFHYMIAMLHLRHLGTRDIDISEKHLTLGLGCIAQASRTMSNEDAIFMNVFMNNGLAFLRMRQGRRREAVDLCLAGFAALTDAVGDDKHVLHRSVLLYNSAQVFVALGELDTALTYYREAILMDPYYSEYYNEMGNILQQQGKFEAALPVYSLAIAYSAPYPEVYFNMGVSHCQMEQWEQALAAFDFSAELDPAQPELYLLRAEVYEALGRDAEAVADYSAALAAGSASVTARVNRAVLYYQAGQLEQALLDMHQAIAQEPENASLYENRAEIYRAMVEPALVSADLDTATRFREAA